MEAVSTKRAMEVIKTSGSNQYHCITKGWQKAMYVDIVPEQTWLDGSRVSLGYRIIIMSLAVNNIAALK